MQSAGQIADLGGGALMAAVGILVALREREVSGEGQLVDVSMADGALSWLAMVAARMLAEDVPPARGGLELAGGLVCYRPYALRRRPRDARRARAEVLAGVLPRRRARGPDRAPLSTRPAARPSARSRRSSPRAPATSGRRSRASTTAASSPCSASTRRSTPSSCARARWWWRSTSPAPSARSACSASRSSCRARPATRRARPDPRWGRTPARCSSASATRRRRSSGCWPRERVAGPAGDSVRGSFMG